MVIVKIGRIKAIKNRPICLKAEELNLSRYIDIHSVEVLQNYTLSHKNVYNNVERTKKNVEIRKVWLYYLKKT